MADNTTTDPLEQARGVWSDALALLHQNPSLSVRDKSWLENVYSGRRYQATVVGVDASTLTARAMLERFTSTASNNFTNYSNAEYDEAFAAAIRAVTDEEATAQYLRCEEILAETAANVYIQDLADLVAVRKGLTGYRFYPLYAIDLSTVAYT